MAYCKIIVPLDGSELSERAVPPAISIAKRSGAEIVFVTVVPDNSAARLALASQALSAGMPVDLTAELSPPENPLIDDALAGSLRRVRDFAKACCDSVSVAALCGDPATEIINYVRTSKSDLVVMATRGRSGLVRGLLGSVTDRVLLRSGVPVLVVRPENQMPDFKLETPALSIVVPLDGSDLAETALKHALILSDAFDSAIVLVRIVGNQDDRSQLLEARSYLDRVGGLLPGRRVETIVSRGVPVVEICNAADDCVRSMVVLSTRGASGFSRWLRGSVADGVLRTASVPTMVVPPLDALLGPSIH